MQDPNSNRKANVDKRFNFFILLILNYNFLLVISGITNWLQNCFFKSENYYDY